MYIPNICTHCVYNSVCYRGGRSDAHSEALWAMWAACLMKPAHCNELIKVMKSGYEAWPSRNWRTSLSRILGKLSNKRADSDAVLHSDPVKSLEKFALELLWCEAWESDCINSSDEPSHFTGVGAGNPLFTENGRDTSESGNAEGYTVWKGENNRGLHTSRITALKAIHDSKQDFLLFYIFTVVHLADAKWTIYKWAKLFNF